MCRYFFAHENNTIMERAKLVCTQADMANLKDRMQKMDIVDLCTRERANTKWNFYELTTLTTLLRYSKMYPWVVRIQSYLNHFWETVMWIVDQTLNNDTFYRMPISSAQCIIGTEKYPDSAILLNYDDDDYSQGYGQIKEAFRALTKDNILHPYISEDDFRSDNNGNNIGYNIHVFDIRYQKNYQSGQSVKIEFKLDKIVPAGVYGYALVLTNRLVSISSDGQRMLDLV